MEVCHKLRTPSLDPGTGLLVYSSEDNITILFHYGAYLNVWYVELERWLSSEENLPVLQRIQVGFPSPTWWLIIIVTPVQVIQCSVLTFEGTRHVPTYNQAKHSCR